MLPWGLPPFIDLGTERTSPILISTLMESDSLEFVAACSKRVLNIPKGLFLYKKLNYVVLILRTLTGLFYNLQHAHPF